MLEAAMPTVRNPKPKKPRRKAKPKSAAKSRRKTKPKPKQPPPERRLTAFQKAAEQKHADQGVVPTGVLEPELERFAQMCLKSPNPTEAYQRIHPDVTRQSAGELSSRLLKKVDVRRRIAELLAQAAQEGVMEQREAMMILSEAARGTLVDYLNAGLDGSGYIDYGPESNNPRAVKHLRTKTEVIKGDSPQQYLITDIELHDCVKAIRTLGQMLGWFAPDKLEVSGSLEFVQKLMKDAEGKTRGLPPRRDGKPRDGSQ
jgi:hypothetical protein